MDVELRYLHCPVQSLASATFLSVPSARCRRAPPFGARLRPARQVVRVDLLVSRLLVRLSGWPHPVPASYFFSHRPKIRVRKTKRFATNVARGNCDGDRDTMKRYTARRLVKPGHLWGNFTANLRAD